MMASEEEEFDAAVEYVRKAKFRSTQEQQLQFYSYFKQATVGPCNVDKPGFFEFVAKTKWEQWNGLGDMAAGTAKAKYMELLTHLCQSWRSDEVPTASGGEAEQGEGGGSGGVRGAFGPVFSSLIELDDPSVPKDVFYHASLGETETVMSIIQGGVSINSMDDDGQSCLHYACDRGHHDLAHALVASGADVNLASNDGQTALHVACSSGNESLTLYLLSNGADVNIKDEDGATPLSEASPALAAKIQQCVGGS